MTWPTSGGVECPRWTSNPHQQWFEASTHSIPSSIIRRCGDKNIFLSYLGRLRAFPQAFTDDLISRKSYLHIIEQFFEEHQSLAWWIVSYKFTPGRRLLPVDVAIGFWSMEEWSWECENCCDLSFLVAGIQWWFGWWNEYPSWKRLKASRLKCRSIENTTISISFKRSLENFHLETRKPIKWSKFVRRKLESSTMAM